MITIRYISNNKTNSEFTFNKNTVYNEIKKKVNPRDLPFYLPSKLEESLEESVILLLNSVSNQISLGNTGTGITAIKITK